MSDRVHTFIKTIRHKSILGYCWPYPAQNILLDGTFTVAELTAILHTYKAVYEDEAYAQILALDT